MLHFRLPPRSSGNRCRLRFRGTLDRKIRRSGNGLIGQHIGGADLQSILPWRKGCQRQKAFQGHLVAGLLHFRGSLFELHHLLVALLHGVDEGGVSSCVFCRRASGCTPASRFPVLSLVVKSAVNRGRTFEEPKTNCPAPTCLAGTCSIWSARIKELASSLSSS